MYNVVCIRKNTDDSNLTASIYDFIKFNEQNRRGLYFDFILNKTHVLNVNEIITKLMKNRFLNLEKYRLRMGVFEDKGFADFIYDANNKSVVVDIAKVYAEPTKLIRDKLNTSLVFVTVPKGERFGTILDNGTSFGELGLIENQKADCTIHTHINQVQKSNNVISLYPTYSMHIVALAPKLCDDYHTTLYQILGFKNGIGLLISIVSVLLVRLCIHYLREIRSIETNMMKYTFSLLAVLFMVSQRMPNSTSERFLIIGFILGSMVLCFACQAFIFQILALQHEKEEFNSLEDVLNSNYKIYMTTGLSDLTKYYSVPPTTKDKLLMKAHFLTKTDEVTRKISHGEKSVLITDSITISYYKYHFLLPNTRKLSMYIVRENFMVAYAGNLFLKKCPFFERLQDLKLRILSYGIFAKVICDAKYEWRLSTLKNEMNADETLFFTLNELSSLFYYYFILNVVSFIVFILEIISHYCSRMRCAK